MSAYQLRIVLEIRTIKSKIVKVNDLSPEVKEVKKCEIFPTSLKGI